jgi:hypothetical protein
MATFLIATWQLVGNVALGLLGWLGRLTPTITSSLGDLISMV